MGLLPGRFSFFPTLLFPFFSFFLAGHDGEIGMETIACVSRLVCALSLEWRTS